MNWLKLGMMTLKNAEKAKRQTQKLIEMGGSGDPELSKQLTIDLEFKKLQEAFDIGLTYFNFVRNKTSELKNGTNEQRTYLLTIRPKHDANFSIFKMNTETFIKKWEKKWDWWEYAFEQCGEDDSTIGNGFHVHILLATTTENYFPSHIIRDAYRVFHLQCERQCIDVRLKNNQETAHAYICGNKADSDKLSAVTINHLWRDRQDVAPLYQSYTSPFRSDDKLEIVEV